MTLREYLDQTRMPVRRFAAWVGVNPQTVWAWLRGDRKPKLAEIERIYRITDGAIRPEDWIERVVPRPNVASGGDVAAFSGGRSASAARKFCGITSRNTSTWSKRGRG